MYGRGEEGKRKKERRRIARRGNTYVYEGSREGLGVTAQI